MIGKIESLDHYGRGIIHHQGKVCFIPNALTGEMVQYKIVKEKKHYAIGKCEKVIEESKDRYLFPCPFYEQCGGCQVAHMCESLEHQFKEEKIKNILSKYTSYHGKTKPILFGERLWYRNKITLHVKARKVGFFSEEKKTFVPITECFLVPPAINRILPKLNQYLDKNPAFDRIQIRCNHQKELQLSIDGTYDLERLQEILKGEAVIEIYHNHQLQYQSKPFQDTIGSFSFHLSDQSFFQVNRLLTETLYRVIVHHMKNQHAKKVLDLYCGVGTIGITISPFVKEVLGIEVVPAAIQNAIQNKEENKISNITFQCGKVEDHLEQLHGYDTWIVDPPRKGLDPKVIDTLLQETPSSIIYVSCDPMTLARDIHLLQEQYEIKEVHPVDMFPNTYHIECVCLLNLR